MAIFGPKKGTKSAKIDFLLKLHFLHFLAKFRQKKAKNYKNMAKKGVFGPKNWNLGGQKKNWPEIFLFVNFLLFCKQVQSY